MRLPTCICHEITNGCIVEDQIGEIRLPPFCGVMAWAQGASKNNHRIIMATRTTSILLSSFHLPAEVSAAHEQGICSIHPRRMYLVLHPRYRYVWMARALVLDLLPRISLGEARAADDTQCTCGGASPHLLVSPLSPYDYTP